MKYNKHKLTYMLFMLTFSIFSFSFAETQKSLMKNYCSIPPYMEADVEPNIILIMDYSGSMQLPAHFGCSWSSYKRVAECNGGSWISRTYNKDKTYYGYFRPEAYYKYNSSGQYWEENTTCNPSDNKKRIGTGSDCVSGNLLNWISMSRYDTALKALTGGKIRGCKSTSDNNKCLIPKGAHRKVKEYNNLNCKFEVYPNNHWNSTSQFNNPNYDLKITVKNRSSSKKCKIGTFSGRWLRVKVNSNEIKGVLQKNANLGNYGLMVFSASSITEYNRKGEIRFGVHEYRDFANKSDAMNALVQKIRDEMPWGGTPTGEAIAEAIDYLKQSNTYGYESNSGYISKGSSIDPFYNPEFDELSPCIKNSILLISDGEWNGYLDPDYRAYLIHTQDLRSDLAGTQNANVFTIFTFANSDAGKNSMKTVAAAGSFNDLDGNGYPYNISLSYNSKYISWPRPKCDPNNTYKNSCKEWDADKDGVPNTFFYASNGEEFEKALTEALNAMVKYNYSGGSLGIMAEKGKDNSSLALTYRGSVLAQTMFYSQKDGVDWIGKIYGYWYHFDTNSIREDSNQDKILEIDTDKILELTLENDKNLKINLYNVNSSGEKTSLSTSFYDPDNIKYLFEEGKYVTENINESDSIVTNDRKVYFAKCTEGSSCLEEFTYTNLSNFIYESNGWKIPLLGIPSTCFNNLCPYINSNNPTARILWNSLYNCISQNNDYEKIVNYIRGKDYTGFRTRTIDGNVWKLGDLMYSVPQIIKYDSKDKSYMFVGANDGMLHVFELGKIDKVDNSDTKIVKLVGNNIGREVWTFIPYNMLPYLRFLTDPDYCHLYYVDLTPKVYKTKDNRLILIGGLRFGGAVANTNTTSQGENPINPVGWSCPATFKNFLKDQCEACKAKGTIDKDVQCNSLVNNFPDMSSCVGFSSYFAIDVTDPENPEFLWEFTHPDLGFSYSGVTMIFKQDGTYVMFGSGPTSYDGNSTQDLRYFVLPLDNPDLENPIVVETSINNGFSGRLNQYGFDANNDGYTDYIFVGYARRDGSMNNWKGGLLLLDVRDVNSISYKKYFTDAQSPIVARVEVSTCFDNPYLFFGTGRWFYKLDNSLPGQKNRIYGVPLNCDSSGNCSPNLNVANSQSSGNNVCTDARNSVIRSWYIELNKNDKGYLKERVITDPVVTTADNNTNKIVIFTTVEPKDDPCGFGGRSRVWVLNCATGGSIKEECGSYPIDSDKVKASILLPLSGGDVKQVNAGDVDKTSDWFVGTAPEGSPPVISGVKSQGFKGEILLWIER